jgi:adenosylcobinamide-GDP ribazoletransferase
MAERKSDLLDDAAAALGFLTRLPVGARLAPERLARAGWAFPLAGLAVGFAGALAWGVADALALPGFACGLLALASMAWFTRGLHEDGLADFADGLAGSTAEARLRIMRDPALGTFGALALVFALGLRAAALGALADFPTVLAALLAAAAASRAMLPALLRGLPPARANGLGHHAGRPDGDLVRIALAAAVVIALVLLPFWSAVAALIAAAAGAWAVAALARRAIGGQTGDVLGAAQQVAETLFLLAVAAGQ